MKQKTAMQQIFERINLWLPINEPLRMELESDMAMWLNKEKQQMLGCYFAHRDFCSGEVSNDTFNQHYEQAYGGKDKL